MSTSTLGVPTVGGHAEPNTRSSASRPRSRERAKSTIITVAGILGMLCILWVLASLVFGFSAIVFKTGSMAPTMPTGSIALERPIAAADITKGDVVTVPVPGQTLPVTHRVVQVSRDPASSSSRILTLKGDANLVPDQIKYTVKTAKLVLVAMPVGGTILSLLRTPLFIGITCVLVIALLFWAFAPDPSRPRYARKATGVDPSSEGESK